MHFLKIQGPEQRSYSNAERHRVRTLPSFSAAHISAEVVDTAPRGPEGSLPEHLPRPKTSPQERLLFLIRLILLPEVKCHYFPPATELA